MEISNTASNIEVLYNREVSMKILLETGFEEYFEALGKKFELVDAYMASKKILPDDVKITMEIPGGILQPVDAPNGRNINGVAFELVEAFLVQLKDLDADFILANFPKEDGQKAKRLVFPYLQADVLPILDKKFKMIVFFDTYCKKGTSVHFVAGYTKHLLMKTLAKEGVAICIPIDICAWCGCTDKRLRLCAACKQVMPMSLQFTLY
jgi:hypothetical protein